MQRSIVRSFSIQTSCHEPSGHHLSCTRCFSSILLDWYTLEKLSGTWKSPVWTGKSSSKPSCLGSMSIFRGIASLSTQIHSSTYMSPVLPPLRELQNALLPRPTVHHLLATLIGQHSFDTPLKTNISCWKNDGWKSTFLRGWSLSSGYLKLQRVNVCCIFQVGLELMVIKPSLQSSDLGK